MGKFTDKALEVKAQQDEERQELMNMLAEAVETVYQADMEVINNVQHYDEAHRQAVLQDP